MHRRLALLIGCMLAALIAAGIWCTRYGPLARQVLWLHVKDERGEPVEWFAWYLDEAPGAMLYSDFDSGSAHPGGVCELHVPLHRISVGVSAPRFRAVLLGPFEADAIPTQLDVKLADLGVVEGVVTYGGKAVEGAAVSLFKIFPTPWDKAPSGVLDGSEPEETDTDARGVFRIPSRSDGFELVVRAWKEGYAAGTREHVRIGDPPIQVELHDGGTLEGHLKAGPGRDLANCEVELYRYDPHYELSSNTFDRFLAPIDSSGNFVFQHVDTGPLLVRVAERARASDDESVPFPVLIEERKTSRLEMDLTRPPILLTGHLTMNGRPWTSCWPALYSTGEITRLMDRSEADSDGNWTLRTRAAGQYVLFVRGNYVHDVSVPQSAYGVFEIPHGGTRFARDLVWNSTDPPAIRLEQGR